MKIISQDTLSKNVTQYRNNKFKGNMMASETRRANEHEQLVTRLSSPTDSFTPSGQSPESRDAQKMNQVMAEIRRTNSAAVAERRDDMANTVRPPGVPPLSFRTGFGF